MTLTQLSTARRGTVRRSATLASPSVRSSLARLRLWWFCRQGLTPTTAPKTIKACIDRTGWLSTSGSTGVYLSIRARMPGVSREAIDRMAVDTVSAMDVPGAHGKPSVLVPRGETALALRLHGRSYRKHLAPHFANGD